eukprot:SAG25_NODE_5202_length_689_cov_2.011864_2_plen_53_part_01
MLHVRGILGVLEDEDALAALFRQCGTVVQATVRHRIEHIVGTGDHGEPGRGAA